MENNIHKICVIGSGVMGSAIAAVIANSSRPVILLDVAANDLNKNSIIEQALKRLLNQKPPPLAHPSKLQFITIGNLEDDLALISQCDLVIEAIIEKIEIKHRLYNKIIPYLKENAILASNTSTLPLEQLKENLPAAIKPQFIITHFFNPPRYMELLELVTSSDTSAVTIERASDFLTKTLGKTIVKCSDTPGFIANRIGCFLLELVVRKAIIAKLNPVVIDSIFTQLFQLPVTGIFALYDLIGHDVMKLISSSLTTSLPSSDDYHKIYAPVPQLDTMLERNLIGRKSGGGFYRIVSKGEQKTKELIDFNDLSYQPIATIPAHFSSLTELFNSNSIYGNFFKEIFDIFYSYLFSLIPIVTDKLGDIDLAMKLGYSWKFGPFELLAINPELKTLPQVSAFLAKPEFQQYLTAFHMGITSNKNLKTDLIISNNSAKFVRYKNCLLFTIATKMSCLNSEVFNLLLKAVDYAEEQQQNLYIYSESQHFSAGADLKFIISCIENKNFESLEDFLKLGQQVMLRLKHSGVNIISCARGVALGGGCELLLHSDFIVAHQELKAGLVEVSVGLIPSWGGVKEMVLRATGNKTSLINNLQNIIAPNKSSSADYFAIDYNLANIKIVMNKELLLAEALQLNLPKKTIIPTFQPITSYKIENELIAGNGHNNLQQELLLDFKNLINSPTIDANSILAFERQKFLELSRRPETLQKLKSFAN